MEFNYAKDSKEQRPYEHYMERYGQMDPLEIAKRTELSYNIDKKTFTVRLMGCTYEVSYPEYEIHHIDDSVGIYPLETDMNAKILILRYLTDGKASPWSGEFVTYRDVPWGEVYFRQFQGRCLFRLAFGYGNKLSKFQELMDRLGADKIESGDAGYQFEFINGLYVRFLLWEGDDEFPPSSQILFSDNFPVAFSAEDLAVMGDISIGLLKTLEKQMA
ncbi:MAG: DUF3786 domain-containing protein [Lachnospiraceae bacterium]|jgi:hypothetical protein